MSLHFSLLSFNSFAWELDIGIVSTNSRSDHNATFVPVFRSGSCSEIGPKPYMEDEHICIDDLLEHLGATAHFPSPGAFYGVCNLIAGIIDFEL